jgi:hypothetical protein
VVRLPPGERDLRLHLPHGLPTLPASDDDLRKWLAAQPGVLSASVRRDGQTVVIEYSRSHWSGQPLVDPVGEAKRFGYSDFRAFTSDYKRRW